MVDSFHFDNSEAISIEEYLEHVTEHVDSRDTDSIAASANFLHRLSLNKNILTSLVLQPIKDSAAEIQPENTYTDATFMLGATPDRRLLVRANVWKVPVARGGSTVHEKTLYAYELPHDHNFDFLTVGYFGAGYCTDLYEFDYKALQMKIGEKAGLRFVERTSLPVGKVMLYRMSKDVHTQLPPDELSISLNLLSSSEHQFTNQQHFFDVAHDSTASFVDGPINSRVQAIELAGYLGIDDAIEPLYDIARAHACPRSRAAAITSILRVAPGEKSRLMTVCGSDQSVIVRDALC